MKNKYTEYLLEQGWIETDPMRYSNKNSEYKIFFDTSSQIDVYKGTQLIKSVYLSKLDDLVFLLNSIR